MRDLVVGACALGCVGISARGQVVMEGVSLEYRLEPVEARVYEAPGLVVDTMHFEALDTEALLEADAVNRANGGTYRFAWVQETVISPEGAGTVQPLDGGKVAWRLRLTCENAQNISIGTLWDVPPSTRMYLLDGNGRTPYTSFGAEHNNVHQKLWTPVVPGNTMEVFIEVDEAEWDTFVGSFMIVGVNLGYRPFRQVMADLAGRDGVDRSGACNVDVACEEADPWCEHVKGAAAYTILDIPFISGCSGSMLNNTSEDETPLFYTANHCTEGTDGPSTMVVYWNFQNLTCREPGSSASAGAGTCGDIFSGGFPCNQETSSGGSFVAVEPTADSVLIELNTTPPDSYEVIYLGWTVQEFSTVGPPSSVGIHHPGVEEKRISIENNATQRDTFFFNGRTTNFWRVQYDIGGVEQGSSGSPLIDDQGRVYGTASAVNDLEPCFPQISWYGRLEHAYDQNADFRSALDPTSTGAQLVDSAQFFPPTAPESFGFALLSPQNSAVNETTGPFMDWNGACFTDDYRVVVSENSNLSNPVVDQVVPGSTTFLNLVDQTLAYDTEYFWRVEANNTVGTTNSPTWSFTTAPPPVPDPFALLSPGNGATDVPTGPLLDWADSGGADDYLVEVDNSVVFDSPEVSQTVPATLRASELQLPDGTLAFDTQYFWRVTANNQTGSTVSSPDVSGFTTTAVPPCPCDGDLDGDCDTDVFDFGIFASNFGQTVPPNTNGDLDGDGDVDVFDFGLFAPEFGCVG